MKLLFLSAQYPPHTKGGGELSAHYIAQGLLSLGHDVLVITEGEERSEDVVDGVRVVRLPMGLTKKPLFEKRCSKKAACVIAKEIGNEVYDVVHAHDFRSGLALSELGLPNAVVTVRDYAYIAGDTNNIRFDGSVPSKPQTFNDIISSHRVAEASLLRKPFRVWQYAYNKGYRRGVLESFVHRVFISRSQLGEYVKHGVQDNNQNSVIYNPIQAKYLSTSIKKSAAGNVLYVGRVEMYKGVGLLIESWMDIVKKFSNVHLTIVGEGAQKKEYEHLVHKLGLQYTVTFKGYVQWDRMMSVYDHASVVAAPHLWIEPFGRTVVEAMARGKIVVASDAGGPSEIITHNKTGLLFERGAVDSLTQQLSRALDMKHLNVKDMQVNARDWVRENLASEIIARQYERLLTGISRV